MHQPSGASCAAEKLLWHIHGSRPQSLQHLLKDRPSVDAWRDWLADSATYNEATAWRQQTAFYRSRCNRFRKFVPCYCRNEQEQNTGSKIEVAWAALTTSLCSLTAGTEATAAASEFFIWPRSRAVYANWFSAKPSQHGGLNSVPDEGPPPGITRKGGA